MKSKTKLTQQEMKKIISDKAVRVALAKKSFLWFALIYFPHYFKYDFADFHHELIHIADTGNFRMLLATMFRTSGKSTLMTTIYPLYALFGKPDKKLVVIVSQTADLSSTHLRHIKSELESNALLRRDLGPFQEISNVWKAQAIELSHQGAMIMATSIDQKIRGLRYKQHRPDLIICDDLEDSSSVKTEEGRKRIQKLYSSEIAPLGDIDTQIVMVGNYLHPSGLLSKLQKAVESGKIAGKSMFVPLVTEDGEITWPQKFPNMEAVNEVRAIIADEHVWMREYLLKMIADHDHFYIHEEMKFYDQIPNGWKPYFKYRIVGIDLAISKETTADYTAVVKADVYLVNGVHHIFILPDIVNKRLNFLESRDLIKEIGLETDPRPYIFVEDVGFQRGVVELLREETEINVDFFKVEGLSKRERLAMTVPWHKQGRIHFPTRGVDPLINQLTGFGYEKHDDLLDGYTMIVRIVQDLAKDGLSPTSHIDPMVKIKDRTLYHIKKSHHYRGKKRFNPRTLKNDREGWS